MPYAHRLLAFVWRMVRLIIKGGQFLPNFPSLFLMYQQTIKEPVTIKGFSPFSKKECQMVIESAPEDFGIVFEVKGQQIQATVDNLAEETNHTTSLAINGIKIQTIEHLMSALVGGGITNCLIKITKEGVPVKTATALDYINPLRKVSRVPQAKKVETWECSQPLRFVSEESWAEINPRTQPGLFLEAEIEFPLPIGQQSLEFAFLEAADYLVDIAWARSFLRSDISKKWDNGKTTWEISREIIPLLPENPKNSPVLCFDKGKWVVKPKTADEPVRHKILDFIGDTALCGRRIHADIKVHWPGHKFNVALTKFIAEQF